MIILIGLVVVAAMSIDSTLGALVFAVALVIAVCLGIRDEARKQPAVIRQMPTRYQRQRARSRSRWVPGAGIGVSLLHGFRPFLYLTLLRWRR